MHKTIAIGETILDIIFRNGQPVAAVPGGSSFNSIISLGRAGLPCAFVGYTGCDRPGQQTLDFLRGNGVSTEYFEMRDDERSAISLAYLNEQGDANYTFYKMPPRRDTPWQLPRLEAGDVVLFGSYFAICQGTRAAINATLRTARESGATLYYDLNFRRSHLHELHLLWDAIHSNFSLSSIVRGSADDFDVMFGTRDAQKIYRDRIAPHCPVFICTAGEGRIHVCTPSATHEFQAPHISDVVSTVGAGDNFNAGFIYGLQREGVAHDMLPTLGAERWQTLVRYACAFAGEACRSTNNYVSRDFLATIL